MCVCKLLLPFLQCISHFEWQNRRQTLFLPTERKDTDGGTSIQSMGFSFIKSVQISREFPDFSRTWVIVQICFAFEEDK